MFSIITGPGRPHSTASVDVNKVLQVVEGPPELLALSVILSVSNNIVLDEILSVHCHLTLAIFHTMSGTLILLLIDFKLDNS